MNEITFLEERMVKGGGSAALHAVIDSHLATAERSRGTLAISKLLREIGKVGVRLHSPDIGDAPSGPSYRILGLLQLTKRPLRSEAIQSALLLSATETRDELVQLANVGVVSSTDENRWVALPLPVDLEIASETDPLERALGALVTWMTTPNAPFSTADADCVIAVATALLPERPQAVAPVFYALDKVLKALGDKHRVYEVAQLSIAAAQRLTDRDTGLMYDAHAAMCGTSWVFQRVGRLDDAQIQAEKSEELGNEFGWVRNTAYAHKCIGRLLRLRAEESRDAAERSQLFGESERRLRLAQETFPLVPKFDRALEEVGESHSLLGRTYLAQGLLDEAQAQVNEAHRLIPEAPSKMFHDLLILDGEVALRRGGIDFAERCFDRVVRTVVTGTELSEIRARALRQFGLLKATTNREAAKSRLAEARQIYRQLDEVENEAKCAWDLALLEERVSSSAVEVLSAERPLVRIAALDAHAQRVASSAAVAGSLAQKADPGSDYWKSLLPEARKAARRRESQW